MASKSANLVSSEERTVTSFALGFVFPYLRGKADELRDKRFTPEQATHIPTFAEVHLAIEHFVAKRVEKYVTLGAEMDMLLQFRQGGADLLAAALEAKVSTGKLVNLLTLQDSFTADGMQVDGGRSTGIDYTNHILLPLLAASGKALPDPETIADYGIVPYMPARILKAFDIVVDKHSL